MSFSAIPIQQYIDIKSGMLAGQTIAVRALIGRLFTSNELLPPKTYLNFSTAQAVGAYFGTSSTEYSRAVSYFGFMSKQLTSPPFISFGRWVSSDVAPIIFAAKPSTSLTNMQLIVDGSINITIGANTAELSSLDFSSATSYSDIASVLETALNAAYPAVPQFADATVAWDSVAGAFVLTGGNTIADAVSVENGITGTNIAVTFGFLPQSLNGSTGAIWANGSLTESLTDCLTTNIGLPGGVNFGSFLFQDQLTLTQYQEICTWNASYNLYFMFLFNSSNANAVNWATALKDTAYGAGMEIVDPSTGYSEMLPMKILASTNYAANRKSTSSYNYQPDSTLTASVTSQTVANSYNALSINYYGLVQLSTPTSFFQQGQLFGLRAAGQPPVMMNLYANEMWLKAAMEAALMTNLLSSPIISANPSGEAIIRGTLESIIDQALTNGVISIGNQLSNNDIQQITNLSGDENAYLSVQNNGYWLGVTINQVTDATSGKTTYNADYILIYGADNSISKINGIHAIV